MSSSSLIIDASSSVVRVVLHAYFSLGLALIGLIGNQCCRLQVLLSLAHRGRAGVLQTTGWLSSFDVLHAVWITRSISVGWTGLFMILNGLMLTVTNIAVGYLVNSSTQSSRCSFNATGDFIVMGSDSSNNVLSTPQYAGYSYNLVTQAQRTSLANGGLDGIYKKLNADTSFAAQTADLFGQWWCDDVGEDRQFDVNESVSTITNSLTTSGPLYNSGYACWRKYTNTTNQMVVWTSNATGDSFTPNGPWDIRVAFDITLLAADAKVMKTFHCYMEAPGVEWIMEHVNVSGTLTSWCDSLRAPLYIGLQGNRTLVSNPNVTIASELNGLIMNVGGGETQNTSLIEDWTQGCIISPTAVPLPILLLFVVVWAELVGALVYWFVLHIRGSMYKKKPGFNIVPAGVFGWMKYAIRQATLTSYVKARGLKNWDVVIARDGRLALINNSHGQDMLTPEAVGLTQISISSEGMRSQTGTMSA